MAAPMLKVLSTNPFFRSGSLTLVRAIGTTPACGKNIRAGVPKITVNRDMPLTYEEANAPYLIGVRKSWNSWNTSNLEGDRWSRRQPQHAFDDILIRRFMDGTWPRLFLSPVIIKRRHNTIYLGGLVIRGLAPRKMYFLIGYTEELLSHLLKCPVKVEIQTVEEKKDVIFKYI